MKITIKASINNGLGVCFGFIEYYEVYTRSGLVE